MATECNCSHEQCKCETSTHKHENGQCFHPDGTQHPIHEHH